MGDKSRKEFEAWVVKRAANTPAGFYPQLTRRSATDENVYMISWVDSAWEGWQAFSESVVIELPQRWSIDGFESGYFADPEGSNLDYEKTVEAIEATGLKVKP